MIYLLVILTIAAMVAFFGWFSIPEKVDPNDFQDPPPKEAIMQGAEPFFFRGSSKRAFLLIHGYESSPYTLRFIGELFHAQGHSVFAPLLPGHGTTIKDLTKTRYDHWYEAVRRVYVRERPRFEEFFILGFSLGANLGLRLSIQYRNELSPSGLILISPPIVLNGLLNGALVLRDWRLMFTGIVRFFMSPISKRRDLVSMDLINPTVSYSEAYSIPPLHSFRTNLEKIKPYLKYLKLPLCIIHASNDWTIDVENSHYILRKMGSKEKRIYLFEIEEDVSTKHEIMTHEFVRNKVAHYIFSFLEDFESGFNYDSPQRNPEKSGFKLNWKK